MTLQACVRKHLLLLCNATTKGDLIKNNPPISDEEMKSFLEDEGDLLTCSVQCFRIDFIRPWKTNAFNTLAKDIFVKSLIATYRGGEYSDLEVPEKLLTEQAIGAVIDKHMEYRRQQYRQQANPKSKVDADALKKRRATNARRYTVRLQSLIVSQ